MSLILPEITIFNIVTSIVNYVKYDIDNESVADSFLKHLFTDKKFQKKSFYNDAKDLFGRDSKNPRKIVVRNFFDGQATNVPTIHITLPSDMPAQNSIGIGEDQDSYFTHSDTTTSPLYNRRFSSRHHIICTSDNHAEVILMYHVIRAALISVLDTVTLEGLENPKISGQDIRPYSEVAPTNLFMRGIEIYTEYEVEVKRWWTEKTIASIVLGDFCLKKPKLLNPLNDGFTEDDSASQDIQNQLN